MRNWITKARISFSDNFASAASYFVLFCLAFYFSTTWTLAEDRAERFFQLLVTLILGFLWSWLAASKIRFGMLIPSKRQLVIGMIIVILLNVLPLRSSIPWRGDESHHIREVVNLFYSLPSPIIVFLLVAMVFIPVLFKIRQIRFFIIPAWIFALIFLMQYFRVIRPFEAEGAYFLLRYPFFSYWFAALAPSFGGLFGESYSEWMYRLLPLLSTVGIIWLFLRRVNDLNLVLELLLGITIATLPILHYYSSLFYLEMPAVLLMFYILLNLDQVLDAPISKLKSEPVWIVLVLIGFLKETLLYFTITILLMRWASLLSKHFFQRSDNAPSMLRVFQEEGRLTFVLLTPILYYLYQRFTFLPAERGYPFEWQNLISLPTYKIYLISFLEQFGLLHPLAVVGFLVLALKKQWKLVVAYAFVFITTLLFFTMDSSLFIGYSRFNLNFLPVVLTLALIALKHIIKTWPKLTYPVLLLLLLANFLLSPFLPDGSRKPSMWIYNTDTAEQDYPYRQAFETIHAREENSSVLLTGLTYGYYTEFYSRQLKWSARMEVDIESQPTLQTLPQYISENANEYTDVVFHVLGAGKPAFVPQVPGFSDKLICNQAHCLILYSRQSQ